MEKYQEFDFKRMKKGLKIFVVTSTLMCLSCAILFFSGISFVSGVSVNAINIVLLLRESLTMPIHKMVCLGLACVNYIVFIVLLILNLISQFRCLKQIFSNDKYISYLESLTLEIKDVQCKSILFITIFLFIQSILVEVELGIKSIILFIVSIGLIFGYDIILTIFKQDDLKVKVTEKSVKNLILGILLLFTLTIIRFYSFISLIECMLERMESNWLGTFARWAQIILEICISIFYIRLVFNYVNTSEFGNFDKERNCNLRVLLWRRIFIILLFIIAFEFIVVACDTTIDLSQIHLIVFSSIRNDYLPAFIISILGWIISASNRKELKENKKQP